mgnify:CR=1 FL=1
MQHREWIEKARKTADEETDKALKALSDELKADKDGLLVFILQLLKERKN